MSKEKTIRQLEEELVKAKNRVNNEQRPSKSRNFDYVGPDPDTVEKEIAGSADIPDVILLPSKKKRRTENKW
tara:strand:- start:5862 stop:6077 length:216 start_codon:yes stop_codon:yes gene_type:complete